MKKAQDHLKLIAYLENGDFRPSRIKDCLS